MIAIHVWPTLGEILNTQPDAVLQLTVVDGNDAVFDSWSAGASFGEKGTKRAEQKTKKSSAALVVGRIGRKP